MLSVTVDVVFQVRVVLVAVRIDVELSFAAIGEPVPEVAAFRPPAARAPAINVAVAPVLQAIVIHIVVDGVGLSIAIQIAVCSLHRERSHEKHCGENEALE